MSWILLYGIECRSAGKRSNGRKLFGAMCLRFMCLREESVFEWPWWWRGGFGVCLAYPSQSPRELTTDCVPFADSEKKSLPTFSSQKAKWYMGYKVPQDRLQNRPSSVVVTEAFILLTVEFSSFRCQPCGLALFLKVRSIYFVGR